VASPTASFSLLPEIVEVETLRLAFFIVGNLEIGDGSLFVRPSESPSFLSLGEGCARASCHKSSVYVLLDSSCRNRVNTPSGLSSAPAPCIDAEIAGGIGDDTTRKPEVNDAESRKGCVNVTGDFARFKKDRNLGLLIRPRRPDLANAYPFESGAEVAFHGLA